MSAFTYWAANAICDWILMPPYAKIKVKGIENLPLSGPLLVASNHLADGDPGILSTSLRGRRLNYMAKAELFDVPLLKQFLVSYGTISVHREKADLSALRQANNFLNSGGALCIFPEGTSSRGKARLGKALAGVGMIALRNDSLVLPVAITGSQHMKMPFRIFRFHRRYSVTVTIGEPFHLPKPDRLNSAAAQAAADQIMLRVADLLPVEYRGYYREGPQANSENVPTEEEVNS